MSTVRRAFPFVPHCSGLLTLLLIAASAQADTFMVTRTDDPVPGSCTAQNCSLRAAVLAANSHAGADIVEMPAGNYVLSANVEILDTLEIAGAGRENSRIAVAASTRAFDLSRGTTLTLRGIGIHSGGGVRSGSFGDGSEDATQLTLIDFAVDSLGSIEPAVDARGHLVAQRIRLSRSPFESIWGLIFRGSSISVSDADLFNNAEGIRIALSGANAQASLARVRVDGGGAENICAALSVMGAGQLTINRLEQREFFTFSDATTCIRGLGGVLNVDISDSTFAQNNGASLLLSNAVNAQIRNTTFVSDNARGLLVLGDGAAATLTHVTLKSSAAAAVAVAQTSSILFINTLIDGSCSGDGSFLRQGKNLGIVATSCGLQSLAGDLLVTDALLGPLAYNGGNTRTLLPQAGSAAIDAVPAGSGACPAVDQRGFIRTPPCDIGAVEANGIDRLFTDGFEPPING